MSTQLLGFTPLLQSKSTCSVPMHGKIVASSERGDVVDKLYKLESDDRVLGSGEFVLEVISQAEDKVSVTCRKIAKDY